jgi:hypothetical protein
MNECPVEGFKSSYYKSYKEVTRNPQAWRVGFVQWAGRHLPFLGVGEAESEFAKHAPVHISVGIDWGTPHA